MSDIFKRQLAGAVCRSIQETTPGGINWTPRPKAGSFVARLCAVVIVVAILLAVLVLAANQRADANAVYPLDSRAVHP